MRLLPQSLFGRMMLILAGGLLIAQLLSAAINFAERDRLLFRASGMQPAQRIADIVKLLDSLTPAERARIVSVLNAPPLIVTLRDALKPRDAGESSSAHAAMFSAVLRAVLGDSHPMQVELSEPAASSWPPGFAQRRREAMMGGPFNGPGMHRFAQGAMAFLVQVRLNDGSWVAFDTRIPPESASLPWRLSLTLLVLLLAVLALSFIAVRWVVRPLKVLASAAEELGKDINRPPLPEQGPLEVRRAAHAFNIMQQRLGRFIQDRTRILAAMSHDLKTPLTRMRLRADLLEDEEQRQRFEKDLKEMEAMVTETLEFMRGIGGNDAPQPVDIMALLESLQADNREMGRDVAILGQTDAPLLGSAPLLKRCLSNLIDNAILYGRRARVQVEERPQALTVRIADDGPGLPDGELEKVFEPFYRLESSRNRETGGTGLGLTIARNIAHTHGGDIHLRNRPEGGLEAALSLPRHRNE